MNDKDLSPEQYLAHPHEKGELADFVRQAVQDGISRNVRLFVVRSLHPSRSICTRGGSCSMFTSWLRYPGFGAPETSLIVLITMLLLASCGGRPRPDVLIITVDTLRADHLGVYDTASSTPQIEALAADGTVFERCAAPMPLTRPSHFSMFTSLYPREHGVLNNSIALPDEAISIAEIFEEHDYQTGAFVGVSLLDSQSGAAQGFTTFDAPSSERERHGMDVVNRAIRWLDGADPEKRIFLWVHLFDPHMPYAPPARFRHRESAAGPGLTQADLLKIATENDGDVPREVLERAKSLYRGEVSFVDHAIGALVSGVGKRRPLDQTVVVLTADHGECFENGVYFEHSDCLWEAALNVPLIVRYPPMFGAGTRVAGQTSIIDVAPTVLRAAGLEIPGEYSGRALQDPSELERRYVLVQHPFYSQGNARWRPQKQGVIRSVAGEPTTKILIEEERIGLVGAEWKFLRSGSGAELYSLSPTVDERENQIESRRDVGDRLRRLLDDELDKHSLNLIDPGGINNELRETLKSLGYL
jgi:arylsulfatase A-like enzyme